jgi:hypothetical protein
MLRRDRPLAAPRERILPLLRRFVRLTGREQAAVAVALLAFLLFAAYRGRGWL